jgi:hypothetical protein
MTTYRIRRVEIYETTVNAESADAAAARASDDMDRLNWEYVGWSIDSASPAATADDSLHV